MAGRRQHMCMRGLHSLDNPKNLGFKKNGHGVMKRFCLPCRSERDRAARLPAGLPPLTHVPSSRQLDIAQAFADGMTAPEIAQRDSICENTVYQALKRARWAVRVAPNMASTMAVLLAYGLIDADKKAPRPEKSLHTAPYVQSVLDLVQGRRAPYQPRDTRRAWLLDTLYAWTEPHAVSVLWAAKLITPRDVMPLFAKEK